MHDDSSSRGTIRSYRDLIAWQKAIALAEAVYIVTRQFPKDELYGLTSQSRRAVVSIASNIAEGHSRNSRGEFVQFLGHARGSLAELETQLLLAARFGFITDEQAHDINQQTTELWRLLNALRNSLRETS